MVRGLLAAGIVVDRTSAALRTRLAAGLLAGAFVAIYVERMRAGIFALGLAGMRIDDKQQIGEIAGMFFFVAQNAFDHDAGSRVIVGEVADHALIDLDDDALRD